MKRIACIRLCDWPVARRRAERPELDAKPVVLCQIHRGGRRVAACSAEARALGVRVGMPLAEATALPGARSLCVEQYDPAGDRQALEKLAVWCGRFSPLVGLDDSPTPDSLLLDITGLARLFGGEGALAGRIVAQLAQRGFAARAAVADTVGAAWAVSHFGEGKRRLQVDGGRLQSDDCRVMIDDWGISGSHPSAISNLQSSLCNHHSAIFHIPPGQAAAALRPLPVEALRLPDDMVELLHQLGLFQIGQLQRLPREDLDCRFGPRLAERWDQATGRLPEPIVAVPCEPELHAGRSLEYPTTRCQTIELLLEQLIAELARMLVRCGRGAVRLDCRLDCPPAQAAAFSIGMFQPTASPRHLFELARMRLERMRLPGPVAAVRVEAALVAPLERRQEELFADGRYPKRARQLAALVDRLASRLGPQSVLRPRLVCDAQPELACQYDPLVEASAAGRTRPGLNGRGKGGRGLSEAELPPRPLRLLARPVPLVAVSIMPDGPPVRFYGHGCEHRIAHAWGPERIETGWWRGRPVRRDYYQVETTTGRRYWLFRHLDEGRWFLHGTFE